MKNIHGSFVGLVMADFVEHLNGDFVMLGRAHVVQQQRVRKRVRQRQRVHQALQRGPQQPARGR